MRSDAEILLMEGVTKRFSNVLANDNISLAVMPGEVHALLGENGAGKSTLMKILYGLYRPDSGSIFINGQPVEITSPQVAVKHGIGMVHQHFMLASNLTAVENAILGLQSTRPPLLDLKKSIKRLRELAEEYQLDVDPRAPVWQLPVGVRQRLEILKALFRNAQLLVLDEPTAVLAPAEVKQLFRIIRRLASEGRGIIFISHKLDEVKEISDRVTVLRAGRVVGTELTSSTSAARLAHLMVGRPVNLERRDQPACGGNSVLELTAVNCLSDRGTPALKNVSLTVREGEIVGVAGVDGNGQRELAECVAGLRCPTSGNISIKGVPVNGVIRDPGLLGFIPEDRNQTGLIMSFDIAENLILKTFSESPFTERGFLRWRQIYENASEKIKKFDVRAPGPRISVSHLSGGNQQRVVIAREIGQNPALVVSAQATRGLDIGAVEGVHELLRGLCKQGAAVLYISTELNEILTLCDRIVVLFNGEIMGEVAPDKEKIGEIGQMMMGQRKGVL